MEIAEMRRRTSGYFFADETQHEERPSFRADGTQIDNELEWNLENVITLALQAAREMIAKDIAEKRSLGEIGGNDVNLKFNFSIHREGPGFSDKHDGSAMVIICDVAKYEEERAIDFVR